MVFDGINPFISGERAYVGLALLRIRKSLIAAGIGVIKKEVHSQKKPSSKKPHDREDDEGLFLIFALSVSLIDKLF